MNVVATTDAESPPPSTPAVYAPRPDVYVLPVDLVEDAVGVKGKLSHAAEAIHRQGLHHENPLIMHPQGRDEFTRIGRAPWPVACPDG